MPHNIYLSTLYMCDSWIHCHHIIIIFKSLIWSKITKCLVCQYFQVYG